MKTSVLMHSAALASGQNQRALREGSSVSVRVVKSNGNGLYRVAFAGGTFDIKSSLKLEEGSVFKAQLSVTGSQIILKKQNLSILLDSKSIQKLPVIIDSNGNISNPKLADYFVNLGLYPDEISYILFNMTKEAGLSFDRALINRARILGKAFKGKEKQASAAAFVLLNKGIKADKKIVEAFLDEKKNFLAKNEKQKLEDAEKVFTDFFAEIISSGVNNKAGLLTIFNHLSSSSGSFETFGNWIKIPFDFQYQKKEINKGKGEIFALLDKNIKNTKKLIINLEFTNAKYAIELDFNNSDVIRMLLASTSHNSLVSDELKKTFPHAETEEISYENFYSFMPKDDDITLLETFV